MSGCLSSVCLEVLNFVRFYFLTLVTVEDILSTSDIMEVSST